MKVYKRHRLDLAARALRRMRIDAKVRRQRLEKGR